ncbi:hypothetical protein CEXT_48211 [Caerostris extrusa]|uniref:Uncharacterized protein n=1 Tax=Caerostris extrusa TaxID=172846 RepID=A0AAV4RT90_CAEEX|nr:hypothetical protein CEXT_48211 [Caerostris extrusa]
MVSWRENSAKRLDQREPSGSHKISFVNLFLTGISKRSKASPSVLSLEGDAIQTINKNRVQWNSLRISRKLNIIHDAGRISGARVEFDPLTTKL